MDKDAGSTSPEPDSKRRKLRKGTTSCWDCKKRKVKCTFDATSNTICISCRRRGAPCIGQDKPEDEVQAHAKANRDALLDRMQRVESLLEHLVEARDDRKKKTARSGFNLPTPGTLGYRTPDSDNQEYDSVVVRGPGEGWDEPRVTTAAPGIRISDECAKLSEELVKAFPCQSDIDVLCKSDYVTTYYCHQIFTKSGDVPESEAFNFVNDIAQIPEPSTTPPVLVAKRMLIFASFLQYYRSHRIHGLTEHPVVIMDRLVDTAVRLVTTNEKVMGCIEGLECTILEGVFHSNSGSLRRAWLAFRKAMVLAQLMRIDLPNPPLIASNGSVAKINPKFMWFRIVYMDSYLSLMLGLPHGGQETHMGSDVPGETPTCKLERAHTLVARRIIDRNRSDALSQDFTVTQALDQELLNAARALPDEYWFQPDYSNLRPNSREAFWETMRLADHLVHYNLVHLLHLPYLLRDDKESSDYAYSKTTCVHASREILYRVIAYHSFNCDMVTLYCRTADFFALMASMTILLAHIDGNRREVKDWRAHQRFSDRAIVSQFLHVLDEEAKHTHNFLTVGSVKTLQCLLDIESETARGEGRTAEDTVGCVENYWSELSLTIPYLGIIKIGRKGITKDWSAATNTLQPMIDEIPESVHVANHFFSAAGFGDALQQGSQASLFPVVPDVRPGQPLPVTSAVVQAELDFEQHQLQHPGLMAGVNDWAFQGVDGAFFDSIMRGTADWDPTLQGNIM
ncbi:hypothetical protein CC86DRAFT_366501 [Ophiobolus disseminans]|uniref:Zn(2)-C6 fungal-type domain-containing protein n=1 Tax=Ophiobolus disseminans TaxID=1469910 RepID=A0A6A7ADQ6_9PLEO|nr:hypothetical protein CC86DRAFT_366501 [Ophiobolus disseminans]